MRAPEILLALLLIAAPPEDARWTTITIGDLTIYSEARDSTTRDVAERMQRMRETIAHVTGRPLRTTLPTRVFVFRSGSRSEVIAAPLGNYVTVSPNTDRIVYHAFAHSIIRGLGELPPWFVEGLAELFSTFTVTRDGVVVGLPVANHMQWLNERTIVDVGAILDPPPGSLDFNDEKPTGIFYAESWALTHYHLLGGGDVKQPHDALTTELRQYMTKIRRQTKRYSFAEINATPIPDPVPLARDELLFALGDLATNGRRDDDGESLLREALRINPSHTGALAALGTLLERTDRRAEAAEVFAKAVKLGSRDARVHIQYGESMLARFGNMQRSGRDVPMHEVEQSRAAFDEALKLGATNPLAWAGRGATYLFTREDAKPGIDALEKSLALAPGQIDVATNLVFLYARSRRRNEAQRLVDRVIAPAGDPTMLAVARDNLLAADILEAGDLLNAQKRDAALKLLRPALKIASTERLSKQISRMIDRALR
jgi:Tfp pilus assembly protein PilF